MTGKIAPRPAPLFLLLVGGLLLLGCNVEATALVDGMEGGPRPSPTAAPSLTPTSAPPTCPSEGEVASPSRPIEFPHGYVTSLREFLSGGARVEALPPLLDGWLARPPRGPAYLRADLTGTGSLEAVVALVNPEATTYPPPGVLVVYGCRAAAMQTLATYLPGPDAFVFPVDAGDLTQDGVPDLVFADVSCRDDTCWHAPHVWSWSNGDFRDVMAGAPRLPYAEFSLDEGRLLARSPGLSSLEAGPQRVITQTWSWSGEVLALTAEEVGPPRYRYHALREGDEALFVGEYAEAFAAYLRVLNDPALDPWAGAYGAQEETRWLRALAHWRLMTLGYELGNFPDAEEHYAALQEWDPEEAGWPVADLARRFHEEYLATGSVMRACRASVDAPEAEFVLRFLNSFGYANPTYNAEGLCPFLGP